MQLTNELIIPDIMTYLEGVYRKETKQANGVLLTTGPEHFINWCKEYLNKNRPASLVIVTDNYGIKLTNGDSFTISKQETAMTPRGSMAGPDNSIRV